MEWIKFSDRMPARDKEYYFLAWNDEDVHYCVMYECMGKEAHYPGYPDYCFYSMDCGYCRNDFTYWMPLPQPPKE